MSCWVVPTIAAELWGVSVDSILQRMRDGDLPYRVDSGFMFVDAAPPAPPQVAPPPTFMALSAAEVEALRDIEAESPIAAEREAAHEEEESQSPDDDEASADLGDWRAARRRTSIKRIPPARLATPQAA